MRLFPGLEKKKFRQEEKLRKITFREKRPKMLNLFSGVPILLTVVQRSEGRPNAQLLQLPSYQCFCCNAVAQSVERRLKGPGLVILY